MKFSLIFLVFCLNLMWIRAEIGEKTATTMAPVQNRFLLNQMRLDMVKLKLETHAQKMKRKRCERLGRNLARLWGLKLRFYNRYCINPNPTDLPPKDYDYS